jgi:hypothetical protein
MRQNNDQDAGNFRYPGANTPSKGLTSYRLSRQHLASFAPDLKPNSLPAKRVRHSDLWFEPGELPRRVRDGLRRAGEPIRAADLVRAVMIDKGRGPAGRESFFRVQWKVRDTLGRLTKRGWLTSVGAGHGILWRIADHAA